MVVVLVEVAERPVRLVDQTVGFTPPSGHPRPRHVSAEAGCFGFRPAGEHRQGEHDLMVYRFAPKVGEQFHGQPVEVDDGQRVQVLDARVGF